MPKICFYKEPQIGSFKGVAEGGFGFAADIIIPYNKNELDQPQLGQFLLVRLSGDHYTLGRITRFSPAGMLATPEGEDYMNRMGREKMEIPDDLKRAKIKYRVNLKLLGAVKPAANDAGFEYAPSQRRLPHLGAPVYWLDPELLQGICKYAAPKGEELGHFALGEFVYSGGSETDGFFEHRKPALPVTFNVNNLVSRRTAVFARAGFGKSNLIKLLVSELYRNGAPKTENDKPAGILIFDADGEYFWPDAKGRPGLCDVPHLSEHIVVYTNRPGKGGYAKWKAGGVKLDLRTLSAGDVFGIILPPDKQEHQNIVKLKSLHRDKWRKLVDLATPASNIFTAEDGDIGRLLGYKSDPQISSAAAEINAARSNIYRVTKMLHDPQSQLINNVVQSLGEGKLVIVDISLLSSKGGEAVAGLLMRKIFSHNQEHFTDGGILPVVAVIEEAQSVLGGNQPDASPFVEWVKEGRKYDLGSIFITQQPGSLSHELLSQTDNWFCFHLLSEGDTVCLGKSNSHYSRDILDHIVAEPIKGNCYMWTSEQPFVLPVRARNFEEEYKKNVGKPSAPKIAVDKAIEKTAGDNLDRMAEELKRALRNDHKEGKLGLLKDGEGRKKIKDGKLWNLIKEAAAITGETRDANDLKVPLFTQLFPGAVISEKEEFGRFWLSAPASEWDKLLGGK